MKRLDTFLLKMYIVSDKSEESLDRFLLHVKHNMKVTELVFFSVKWNRENYSIC